ncbi:MAG: ATP synthase F0 subunit C [Myxococcota bacterium]|nr:ATP synthase F0 subunit C [Myxococcota bacterium]
MFKFRKAFTVSVLAIFALCVFGSVALAQAPAADAAEAATSAATGAADNEFTMKGYIGLAIGFGLGIAAFGGAMGQGRAAAAALEGIARNPGASGKIFTPMILGLALIESLVIYSLLISFLLLGKL